MTFPIRLAVAFAFLAACAQAYAFPLAPGKPAAPPAAIPLVLAQGFHFELGVSDGLIYRSLTSKGYSEIKITKRRMTKARAEACKGGKRYDVEISFDGRITGAKKIGSCRPEIDARRAQQILQRNGYRQIQLNRGGDGFLATACRGGNRLRIAMSLYGDIQGEKQLGRCGGALSEHDVRALLRARGYSRIGVKREHQRGFFGVACRGDRKVELRVTTDGMIVGERSAGRCEPPIHPASIPSLLARYGFSRIDVIDRQLPRYIAVACRGLERVEVSLDRFGEIVDERRIGRCDPPPTSVALEALLRDMGYRQVLIIQRDRRGIVAEVCDGGTRLRLRMTIYGETVEQEQLGRCESRRVRGVLRDLEKRGLEHAKMFVVGCRKGMRVRLELDRYGGVVSSKVKGPCPPDWQGATRRR